MKIKRIITAEGKSGVAMQTDTINTDPNKYLSNIARKIAVTYKPQDAYELA